MASTEKDNNSTLFIDEKDNDSENKHAHFGIGTRINSKDSYFDTTQITN